MKTNGYIYRNLLIFERYLSKNDDLFNSLKTKFNLTFDMNTPFEYKNKSDKIILFYEKPFYNDDDIHSINRESDNLYFEPIINSRLLVNNFNIKLNLINVLKNNIEDNILINF
jgi:hypothetical protein